MVSHRKLLSLDALGGIAGLLRPRQPEAAPLAPTSDARFPGPRVRPLNGWRLPHRVRDGVKEFHLLAEPVEHEFAPGCMAGCWGYNGSTPGPTIEAHR